MRISDWSSDVCSSDLIAGLAGNAFHIEPARAEATPAQRIVDDANAGRKDHLAQLVLQEGRAARHGGAVDGRGEVAARPSGDPRIEPDRAGAPVALGGSET